MNKKMGELLPNSYIEGRRFKEFYENNLLQLGKNVEKISLLVIPFILRRDLFIYKFNENDINHIWIHTDGKENQNYLPISLIYINDSYFIIYGKNYFLQFKNILNQFSNINIKSNSNNNSKDNYVGNILDDIDNIDEKNIKDSKNSINKISCYLKKESNENNKPSNNNLNIQNVQINQNTNEKINNNNFNNNINNNDFNNNLNNNFNNNFTNAKTTINNNYNNIANTNTNIYNNINNNNINKNINNINDNYNKTTINNLNNFNNFNMSKNINMNNFTKNNYLNNGMSIKDNEFNTHTFVKSNNNNNYILKNQNNNFGTSNNIYQKENNNFIKDNTNLRDNINNVKNTNIMFNNDSNTNNYNKTKYNTEIGNKNNNNNFENKNMLNNYINKNSNTIISNNNMNNNYSINYNKINQNQGNGDPNLTKQNSQETNYNNKNNNLNLFDAFPKNQYTLKAYTFTKKNFNKAFNNNWQCFECRNGTYCENCIIKILIDNIKNNYPKFIKENKENLIKEKPKKIFSEFLTNLIIYFPNQETKTFSETIFLLTDSSKNIFNSQLNIFKSLLCLGCFKYIKDESRLTENKRGIYIKDTFLFKFPCGCIFCSEKCLNDFLVQIPIMKMSSFICACGEKYNCIKLKYLLYFAISHNLNTFKKEIMRIMFEYMKNKCCICNMEVPIIQGIKSNFNIFEISDQEIDQIFKINKFNHLVCNKCSKSKDIAKKNVFYCKMCSSEHSILNKRIIQNGLIRTNCLIF